MIGIDNRDNAVRAVTAALGQLGVGSIWWSDERIAEAAVDALGTTTWQTVPIAPGVSRCPADPENTF